MSGRGQISKLFSVLSVRANHLHKIGRRTFLSDDYRCQEAWKNRLNSAPLNQLKFETMYVELVKKFQTVGKASAIDIDLLAQLATQEAQLIKLEAIANKFRRCPNTAFALPSMEHAIIRAFLEHKQTDTLMRMVNDRLNYGLFPDYYLSNILMDTFLKEENFRDAVKVGTQMMLQEEFEHPIANCMALYSCYAYLKRPQPEVWDPQPQPKPEEPTEVVKVRVDYLRELYFDDHFDLTEPRHLIGKSLVGFGKCFEESVRHTSTLLGWTMFGKHDKVIQHLDDILGSPSNAKPLIYKEWASHSQKLVQEASEPLPEGFVDQFNTRLQRLENEGFLCDGDILERIRQLTTEAVQKHQKSDIDVQLKTYAEWEERRQFEVDAQIKEIDRRQRLAVLEAKKRELQEKEELLHFFDNLDEWELRYQEKEEVRQERNRLLSAQGKKVSAKLQRQAEEDSYVPPEVSKKYGAE